MNSTAATYVSPNTASNASRPGPYAITWNTPSGSPGAPLPGIPPMRLRGPHGASSPPMRAFITSATCSSAATAAAGSASPSGVPTGSRGLHGRANPRPVSGMGSSTR